MTGKLYSRRHGANLYLGKQAAEPIPEATPYSEVRKWIVKAGVPLPKPPAHFDHSGDFRAGPISSGGWGMLGNGPCDDGSIPTDWAAYNGAGNCFWAGSDHETMEAAKNGGRPVPLFTCRTAIEDYAACFGYNPQTGAGDNGSVVATGMRWRQTKGVTDAQGNKHKIGKVITGTPGDLAQLYEMAYIFEAAGMGVTVTQAQMDQFDAHKPWDYVKGSPVEGGHYIPDMSRLILISWAEAVPFTVRFFEEQNDETVACIDPLRYSQVTGKDAEGYDDQDLEAFAVAVAKQKAAALGL